MPNSWADATDRAGNVKRPPEAIAPTANAPASGSESLVARRAIGRATAASYGTGDADERGRARARPSPPVGYRSPRRRRMVGFFDNAYRDGGTPTWDVGRPQGALVRLAMT